MAAYRITHEELKHYNEDGFFIVRSLFDKEEMKLLREALEVDRSLAEASYDVKDKTGGTAQMAIWESTGDDLYGLIARSERLVKTMECLLGDEVYHWHSKMAIKQPYSGGAWEWHQDYGYWYDYGCLFPLLSTCMLAVDRATRENGCLQVLKGSHQMGRLNHGKAGTQAEIDPERLDVAMKTFENVHCEMEVGDAVLFHCNLLHGSAQNKSPNPRRAFLCCYNAKRNSPYKVVRHPQYTPLLVVSDAAIKEAGVKIQAQDYRMARHYESKQ